jgi:hypothetical protein
MTTRGAPTIAIVRLDLLASQSTSLPKLGTPTTAAGVATGMSGFPDAATVAAGRPGFGWHRVVLALLVSLTLLGQGDHLRVDPRFRSPSRTLLTYWEAQREGDADLARDCFTNSRSDQPEPGAVWFLPPTDDLWLAGFHSLPVTAGRVMVRYEVHFRPRGSAEERMFKTGSELVRARGEWRIAQPIGEASMPEWKPEPGPVDS